MNKASSCEWCSQRACGTQTRDPCTHLRQARLWSIMCPWYITVWWWEVSLCRRESVWLTAGCIQGQLCNCRLACWWRWQFMVAFYLFCSRHMHNHNVVFWCFAVMFFENYPPDQQLPYRLKMYAILYGVYCVRHNVIAEWVTVFVCVLFGWWWSIQSVDADLGPSPLFTQVI